MTGIYVKKVLNYAFGFNWDFEVVEHGKEENHIWVLGKLTVKGFDNKTKSEGRISKMQFGRSEVKMKKTGGMLDFGNDLKAACTDSLKKCASEFGIASDIYGKNEFKDIGKEVVGNGDSKPVITSDNGYIEKLRKFAKDNGADTDAKAIILINGLTGLKLIDFPKSQTHAQRR
ncbi:hypothetical protein IID10_08945 [candidate division KSB1 bacterium]|nr:hypothetical protein [candidate division KSB1 bacterium]